MTPCSYLALAHLYTHRDTQTPYTQTHTHRNKSMGEQNFRWFRLDHSSLSFFRERSSCFKFFAMFLSEQTIKADEFQDLLYIHMCVFMCLLRLMTLFGDGNEILFVFFFKISLWIFISVYFCLLIILQYLILNIRTKLYYLNIIFNDTDIIP